MGGTGAARQDADGGSGWAQKMPRRGGRGLCGAGGRRGGRWLGEDARLEHAGAFARGDVVAVGSLAVADVLNDDGAVASGVGTIW